MTELLPEDDAATVNWGSQWQMPSWDQIDELIDKDNTTVAWTTLNGVKGCKIMSRSNGKSIFLPMTGNFTSSLSDAGSVAYYSSRTLKRDYSGVACDLHLLFENEFWIGGAFRCEVRPVRPVRKK